MHSTWNSWPHGRLMTRLTPSTYSSRQTTHSLCLPPYFRLPSARPASRFSTVAGLAECSPSNDDDAPCAGTSDVVLERGRDREEDREGIRLGAGCSSGVVGDEAFGVAIDVVLASLAIVW